MDFGEALRLLKQGRRVQRLGWNGKGMFLFLVPGSTFAVNRPPLLGIYPEGHVIRYQPHIDMKTADGSVVPWLCSQSDALAEDWVEVGNVQDGVPINAIGGVAVLQGEPKVEAGATIVPLTIVPRAEGGT